MDRLSKHRDSLVRRLLSCLAVNGSHVYCGYAHRKNKNRTQNEPTPSLSPHVPSGHFRALFSTPSARILLPRMFRTCVVGTVVLIINGKCRSVWCLVSSLTSNL